MFGGFKSVAYMGHGMGLQLNWAWRAMHLKSR